MRATGLTQVVLIPRLITYFCCCLLDPNGVRACTRNNTGCVESSFDQSLTVVLQSHFCAQGLCVLGQVALACLWNGLLQMYHLRYCLSWFCIQISRTSPQRRAFLVASVSLGFVGGCALQVFCLGGFCSLALPRTHFGILYSDTLSARDVGGAVIPHPTALLTVTVLVNGGSALPWVSTSLLILRLSLPGIARLLSHRLVSAEPHALTATCPFGHSLVFPHLDVRRVYLVDSFIARDPQHNTHTTSLLLTLSGHTFSG